MSANPDYATFAANLTAIIHRHWESPHAFAEANELPVATVLRWTNGEYLPKNRLASGDSRGLVEDALGALVEAEKVCFFAMSATSGMLKRLQRAG